MSFHAHIVHNMSVKVKRAGSNNQRFLLPNKNCMKQATFNRLHAMLSEMLAWKSDLAIRSWYNLAQGNIQVYRTEKDDNC